MILHPFLPAPCGQSRQTSHTTEAEAVQTKLPARVNLILRDLKGKVFRVVFDLAWCNLTKAYRSKFVKYRQEYKRIPKMLVSTPQGKDP